MKRNEKYARREPRVAAIATKLVAAVLVVGVATATAQTPAVTPPQPSVPEVFTIQGQFVRMAYNNEGFATLGYRSAQSEIGKEWMLLLVGITLRKPTPDFNLKREKLS